MEVSVVVLLVVVVISKMLASLASENRGSIGAGKFEDHCPSSM